MCDIKSAPPQGRVLVAVLDGSVFGYLLYRVRLRRHDIAVVHLAVDEHRRGAGVGKALLSNLFDEVAEFEAVELRCRQDFPAHDFWLRSGFEAVDEQAGRSADGKLLTRFQKRLAHTPTLFDEGFAESHPVAVDLNVLIDLATDREVGQLTRDVFRQIDQFGVHPIRTRALLNELVYHPEPDERTRARGLMDLWEAPIQASVHDRLGELMERIPDAETSDLRHLADAEACDARVLLSRDRAFLQAASEAAGVTTVEVLDPATYIDRLVSGGSPRYLPTSLRGLTLARGSDFLTDELVDRFVDTSAGERKVDLRERIRRLLASNDSTVACLVSLSEGPRCLYALKESEGCVEVELFRWVDGSGSPTMARQALAQIRREATENQEASLIRLSGVNVSSTTERALLAEGFRQGPDAWHAVAVRGCSRGDDVMDLLRRVGSDERASVVAGSLIGRSAEEPWAAEAVERALDPVVVAGTALPALVMSIRAGWSDRLLGSTVNQLDLETYGIGVSSLREHVYFRSPSGLRIDAPSRVFWYRTGEPPSRLFAVSVIDRVLVASQPEVWGRFGGYGVLQREDLADMADGQEKVMALRFVRTRRLAREVTLGELRVVAADLGVRKPAVPQGPLPLDPLLHRWLLTEVGVE